MDQRVMISTRSITITLRIYFLYLPFFLEKFNFKNYTYDSKTRLLSTDNSYRNYNDYVEIDE